MNALLPATRQVAEGDLAQGLLLVGSQHQPQVIHPGHHWWGGHGCRGWDLTLDVAADHKRDCCAERAALPIDVEPTQVIGIEAQLHAAIHQGRVHRVALASEGDGGGAAHRAEDRCPERLA